MTALSKRPRLILGSASPRRLELLAQIGVVPDEVRAAEIDETPLPGEVPRLYCARTALGKLTALPHAGDALTLCADTTVALGRRILGKPEDASEAREFLKALSGRRHRVLSAVALRRGETVRTRVVGTIVRMKQLSALEIDAYIASGEWQGKAGGYGIQGRAEAFVPWIRGSYSAVVGLPLAETSALLDALGYPVFGEAP
ncbi:MAG: nucleoside triphosphate pyrophosphatase [Pseudomonadota bacterium]